MIRWMWVTRGNLTVTSKSTVVITGNNSDQIRMVTCWTRLRRTFMQVTAATKNIKKSCERVIWVIYDTHFTKTPHEARVSEGQRRQCFELRKVWVPEQDTSFRNSDYGGNQKRMCHVTCGPGSVPVWHKNKNPIFALIGLNESWQMAHK